MVLLLEKVKKSKIEQLKQEMEIVSQSDYERYLAVFIKKNEQSINLRAKILKRL